MFCSKKEPLLAAAPPGMLALNFETEPDFEKKKIFFC